MDVLVEPSGQINAAIVGVGGFLGAGEKDVAVNFSSIKPSMKNNKMYLQIAANSGRFALNREISVCAGLRGGAERTRTSNQAVMSRHRGLGGLELATKRLSPASSEH